MTHLSIIYQDDDIVVIDKPSGLLVHRSKMAQGVKEFALQILRNQIGQRVYPVHRLDRPTSGILVFALSEQVLAEISGQFERCETRKQYQCVVRGFTGEGVIDHPLSDPVDDRRLLRQGVTHEAKDAVSEYKTLEHYELPWPSGKFQTTRYSLVEVYPKTGRRHQIRKHMDHIAHPIIGDTRYGQGSHNRRFRDEFSCHRLLLAATGLEMTHPVTKQPLQFEVPPAEEMTAVIDQLRAYQVSD
ncbi:pseudouridine synthase [Litoribrevibacter albus]|uniref:tRNA pseudouridine synthase C n=1 Tax=Litoribrevibacter albus TaxID=1473156 RepID=A0AA37W5B6_9GAMM|nr:pseudouridine synthase [Litoribrevibacter albus]GLQ31032.1 tRNA pseudouridine synthase C [Litoribrevibacter albus]